MILFVILFITEVIKLTDSDILKKLRKELNIKQGEFAKRISTTQGHISDIENGRKKLSDRTKKIICLQDWNGKKISTSFINTGEGTIFIEPLNLDETATYVSSLLEDTDSPINILITEIMHTYANLDESSRATLNEFSLQLLDNIKKR